MGEDCLGAVITCYNNETRVGIKDLIGRQSREVIVSLGMQQPQA